ncbi:DnaB-like helicase C-terminal domain-containing protein [Saccharothrix lopnurensis]|uniref:DnaB-like helicase C-terminal domain-containing protein n=1 Tax=Saccharothrix lopnurensis TaxID=1670621 RepID=A0ABW1P792_9PSEU
MTAPVTDPLRPLEAETYLVTLLTPVTRRALRDEALTQVDPGCFADPMFEHMWRAARALRDDDRAINVRNLLGRMRDDLPQRSPRDHASVQRAARWFEGHAGHVPEVGPFGEHIATVTRCGRLRRLVEVLDSVRAQALEADDPAQALTLAYEQLGKLDQADDDEHVHSYADLLDQFLEAQRTPDDAFIVPTPWTDLNGLLLGGLRAGRMYVVGGRPGDGKSISVLQMAHRCAELGHAGLVLSAEMGAPEVTDRMVSSGAVVEQSQITRRRLDDDGWNRIGEYYNRARSLPITVVDKPNLTLPYIKSVAREAKRRNNIRFMAVDYLQLVGSDSRGQQREQEVAAISRGLKQLSRELDIVVLVAAQLNRENVRAERRPKASDLRESGGIEADADVIILHHRPLIEEGDLKGQPGYTVVLYVDKNRIGRTGFVELDWRAHYATLGSTRQHAPIGGA